MKKLTVVATAIGIFLSLTTQASAHLIGQAPFFEVDGKYSNFYSVPTTSLNNFPLAQDAAPDNYLTNQAISFKLDTTKLPVPPDIIKRSKFTWDFGDGEKGVGLINMHTYKKMGSYLLSIYVDDGTNPTPQLLESIELHILPDKSYHLPQAVIHINTFAKPNATNNEFHIPMHQPVLLDASLSTADSGKIVSYFWDLGDGTSKTGKQVSYTYGTDTRLAFVVLRVKDNNGFIADSYTALRNDNGIALPTKKPTNKPFISTKLFFVLLGAIIIVIGIITGLLMIKKPA